MSSGTIERRMMCRRDPKLQKPHHIAILVLHIILVHIMMRKWSKRAIKMQLHACPATKNFVDIRCVVMQILQLLSSCLRLAALAIWMFWHQILCFDSSQVVCRMQAVPFCCASVGPMGRSGKFWPTLLALCWEPKAPNLKLLPFQTHISALLEVLTNNLNKLETKWKLPSIIRMTSICFRLNN